eukprot:gene9476-11228_t
MAPSGFFASVKLFLETNEDEAVEKASQVLSFTRNDSWRLVRRKVAGAFYLLDATKSLQASSGGTGCEDDFCCEFRLHAVEPFYQPDIPGFDSKYLEINGDPQWYRATKSRSEADEAGFLRERSALAAGSQVCSHKSTLAKQRAGAHRLWELATPRDSLAALVATPNVLLSLTMGLREKDADILLYTTGAVMLGNTGLVVMHLLGGALALLASDFSLSKQLASRGPSPAPGMAARPPDASALLHKLLVVQVEGGASAPADLRKAALDARVVAAAGLALLAQHPGPPELVPEGSEPTLWGPNRSLLNAEGSFERIIESSGIIPGTGADGVHSNSQQQRVFEQARSSSLMIMICVKAVEGGRGAGCGRGGCMWALAPSCIWQHGRKAT